MERHKQRSAKPGAALVCVLAAIMLYSSAVLAESGGGGADRADQATERAARDAARAEERAQRDMVRYTEERAEILQRNQADPVRQQEDLARLEADLQEDIVKAQEDAARDAADFAEELQKAADDVAEDAAERAEDVADFGSSAEMHELASEEAPDFDEHGFPVRRGEIVALDLTDSGLVTMQQQGFQLIAQEDLLALGSRVSRLAAPENLEAAAALAEARRIEPEATFDYTHYYRMQFNTAGEITSGPGGSLPHRSGALTIGMIDTAVLGHPSLRSAEIEIRDFGQNGSAVPTAHGTAVASILVSEGTRNLYVANVFRGTNGEPFTSADALARALEWLVASDVPVVNMSLAGPRNAILDRLITQSVARGTLIVAAAGNGGPNAPPAYPAALRPVVAVTAVDARQRVYRYANQGEYITVAARGVDEPAADPTGGVSRYSGTSFATPHVAAWLARCLVDSGAAACARTLRTSARDLGEPGHDPVYGHGLLVDR